MPRQPKLHKLTFSLLRDGATIDTALKDAGAVTGYPVPPINDGQDALFASVRHPTPPPWRAFLKDHVVGGLDDLVTASASAVLFLEASDRLFAVTFGYGRHLLDPEVLEHDFGLKVVLNTVAPDQLKSVDAKTIDETAVHTRRDVSRDSAFSTFGLDVSHDLLRAVTGTPRDTTLANRLTGSDSLGLRTRAQVPDLPALAERLLNAYNATDYREHFDFVDHLRVEKNAARVQQLQDRLLDDLNARNIDDAHLAAPETLDWLDLDGFRLTSVAGDELDNDPRISAYLDSREGETLDLALLKRDKLEAVRASDGQRMNAWSIYRCLVYEVELDGMLFALSAGQWFRVDLGYRDQVFSDVNGLTRLEDLPDADVDTDEDTYNAKAAAHLAALCLDKKLVYDEGPDKMEICDILTRHRGLIHVKHRGSSSTLSHLFAQGINCAERLLLDQDFRTRARAVAAEADPSFADVLPATRPNPSDYEISFVVITRSNRDTPLTLPFFSVVSLRAAARTLMAFGYKVSVAVVHEHA